LHTARGAQVVSKNKHERRKAAAEAEGLLVEERLNFEAWRDSLETVPTIKVSRAFCHECCYATCMRWLSRGLSAYNRRAICTQPARCPRTSGELPFHNPRAVISKP